MLYILFSIIIYIPVFLGFGSIFQKIFGKLSDGLALKMLSGILFLGIYWGILAFVFPLNLFVEIATIIIGFASFFYFKNYLEVWNFITDSKLSMIIGLIGILFFTSFSPFILDHFGYYVPTIKWLSEFGLVKGIGNLDLILGQMSSWHILQAGFSNFTDSFLKINAIALLIYYFYILEKKAWFHLCLLPILFFFLQSPSPDLPAIAFSLIILQEILNGNKNYSLLFLFSIFIFTLKPTVIWLPIFVFLYSIFSVKLNLKFILLGSFVLLLFMFKNIWTFGYPIFPLSMLDVGIPWKPNADLMKISSETAILKTYDMQFSIEQIQQFTIWEHIKNWFFLDGIKAKINSLFILSLIIFTIFTFIKKKKVIYFLWIAIIIKSILVLSFSAQYRFFLDVFFVIIFLLFYELFSKKWSILVSVAFSFGLMILFVAPKMLQTQLPSFRLGEFMQGFQKDQWKNPPEYTWNQFKTYKIGNLTFNVVQNYSFSFDTELPAINPSFLYQYQEVGIFPQKIGPDLKDGFTWRKLTNDEKKKLKIILEELEK